jgi:hypothetical protein
MTHQSDAAAERSAHVTRGAAAPSNWPVVQREDGSWQLKVVAELQAENEKLRAALSRAKKLFLQDEPQKAFIELCAALGEKG